METRMEHPVVRSLRWAVEKVEYALSGAWDGVLAFVGATEDSSLWWRSVFERKIQKGDVGISIRWFHSKKIDVLWELTSMVDSLSKEHQGSAEKLKDITQEGKRTPSFFQPGQDSNVNNDWFTKQSANTDLCRRKCPEYLNKGYAMQSDSARSSGQGTQRGSEHIPCKLSQVPRDFNESSVCFSGGTFNAVPTSSDPSSKINTNTKYTARQHRHRSCLASTVESTSLQRSASCPDLLFGGDASSSGDKLLHISARTCSLPSLCHPDISFKCKICLKLARIKSMGFSRQISSSVIPKAARTYGNTNEKVNKICAQNNELEVVATEDWSLDNLLAHQDALNSLWEDDLCPQVETEKVDGFCCLLENGQTELNKSRNEINNDNSTNKCNNEAQNTYKGKYCSNNMTEMQCECCYDYDTSNTSLDLPKQPRSNSIKLCTTTCQENVMTGLAGGVTGLEYGDDVHDDYYVDDDDADDFGDQVNWNAFTGLRKNSGSPVDYIKSKWHQSGLPHPSSDSGISSQSNPHATSGRKKRFSCLRACCQRFVLCTPNPKPIPLKKAKQMMDVTKEDSMAAKEMEDVYSLAHEMPIKSQEGRSNIKTPFSRYLGVETVRLQEPPTIDEEYEKDVRQQSALLRLICAPFNLIQSPIRWLSFLWTGGNEGRLDQQRKRTTLHSSNRHTAETTRLNTSSVYSLGLLDAAHCIQSTIADQDINHPTHDSPRNNVVFIISYTWKKLDAKVKRYYLTGLSAFKYYKLLTMTEAKYDILRLQAERDYLTRVYKWKQDTVMDVVRVAKDYYSGPTERNLARWKFLKKNLPREHQSFTDVRMAVSKIPDYFPYFTINLTLVQLIMLIIVCRRYGVANAGVLTLSTVKSDIPTFLGMETFRHLEEPNPWYGPPVSSFIALGAVLASCVAPLEQLKSSTTRKGYRVMAERNRNYFGCCEMEPLFNRAGTTTQHECLEMTSGLGKWKMGIVCSDRPSTQNSVAHVIKPCCAGYHGECVMVSHEHCELLEGHFHFEHDHCVQVNCLNELCNMTSDSNEMVVASDAPWLPDDNTHWQWWRYLTAIPLVYGAIHYIVMLPMQLSMMIPLEVCVGCHRIAILYISSAITGEMVGASLEPLLPHLGSTSGMGGVIGVAIIELFQAWNFLRCPEWEAIKLSALIVLMLFLGTFYLISTVSFLAGLLVGMIMCLIVVPYITFGRRLGHFRSRLIAAGLILITITLVTANKLLYLLKKCQACLMLECIPYTNGMCMSYYQSLQRLNSNITYQ